MAHYWCSHAAPVNFQLTLIESWDIRSIREKYRATTFPDEHLLVMPDVETTDGVYIKEGSSPCDPLDPRTLHADWSWGICGRRGGGGSSSEVCSSDHLPKRGHFLTNDPPPTIGGGGPGKQNSGWLNNFWGQIIHQQTIGSFQLNTVFLEAPYFRLSCFVGPPLPWNSWRSSISISSRKYLQQWIRLRLWLGFGFELPEP